MGWKLGWELQVHKAAQVPQNKGTLINTSCLTYKWRTPQEKKIRAFSPRFIWEEVNKMASKVETLNICVLDPNWKLIHDDVILSRKNDSHDATPNFNQRCNIDYWLLNID